MARMTLAYALYFQCPRCGQHIDVGESSEEVSPEQAKELGSRRGMEQMEGVCPECEERVVVSVSALRSRARN